MVARTNPPPPINSAAMPEPEYVSAVADDVTSQISSLTVRIIRELPPGREYALCVTKLEEAMFWLQRGRAARHAQPENKNG